MPFKLDFSSSSAKGPLQGLNCPPAQLCTDQCLTKMATAWVVVYSTKPCVTYLAMTRFQCKQNHSVLYDRPRLYNSLINGTCCAKKSQAKHKANLEARENCCLLVGKNQDEGILKRVDFFSLLVK